ncbi:MAG: FeoB-associated Cys-rich membrane protein [Pyrinomonadaceae bacterium]
MDFQTILVILIISAAAFYVGRRVFSRLRSFSSNSTGSCETGCGKCAAESKPSKFVKLKRS